jgi:hypothetical protein
MKDDTLETNQGGWLAASVKGSKATGHGTEAPRSRPEMTTQLLTPSQLEPTKEYDVFLPADAFES